MKSPNDDYDTPWKTALERYFREFLACFDPGTEAAIDWSWEPEFLDQELRQVTHDAEAGARRLDKLVRVHLLNGGELYLHIEVQLCRQRDFARRMFTYNSRLFERYGCAVASLAVLADRSPSWRPDAYYCQARDTRLGIEFRAIKLLDLAAAAGPPGTYFELMAAAHFAAMRTRHDPVARLASKLALTELPYRLGWSKQRILDFHDALDWMLQLPPASKAWYQAVLAKLERRYKMPYVNSMVREAIADGRQRGLREGRQEGRQEGQLEGRRAMLAEMLELRFGRLDAWAKGRLKTATEDELSRWAARALAAGSVGEVLAD